MEIKNFEDLGEYLFVSATDNNGKKEVGSIYFRNGRIRLVHKEGPVIEGHDSAEYSIYFIKEKSFEIFCFGKSQDDRATLKNNLEILVPTLKLPEGNLHEDIKNKGIKFTHMSRGIPQFLDIETNKLKQIYDTVSELQKIYTQSVNFSLCTAINIMELGFETYPV